jgi:hypothetical protein
MAKPDMPAAPTFSGRTLARMCATKRITARRGIPPIRKAESTYLEGLKFAPPSNR